MTPSLDLVLGEQEEDLQANPRGRLTGPPRDRPQSPGPPEPTVLSGKREAWLPAGSLWRPSQLTGSCPAGRRRAQPALLCVRIAISPGAAG